MKVLLWTEEDVKRGREESSFSNSQKNRENLFMCREELKLTGDHVCKEPAGATVYTGGFGCLVSD